MDFNNIKKPLGINSSKWFPAESNNDLICMSISDLDFKTPDFITNEIRLSLENGYFGYKKQESEKTISAMRGWFLAQHNWDLKQSQFYFVNRISQGAKYAINALTKENDGIVVLSPIYPVFRNWTSALKRRTIDNELIRGRDGDWSINFKQLADKDTTMILLCNPHNPIGRAWSHSELKQIGYLCKKHDVIIVSDDAHCEIHRINTKYTPIAQVCPNNKVVTLVSPAKAFGTASLSIAAIIFSNDDMAKQVMANPLFQPSNNPLSIAALTGAYSNGQQYISQLNQYLDGNFDHFKKWIKDNKITEEFKIPDATYLVWLDISSTGKDSRIIKNRCLENGVFVTDGRMYGEIGKNFIRINIGTSRPILQEGLSRIQKALS